MQRSLTVAGREKTLVVDCFSDWQQFKSDRNELVARLNDWIHPNHASHRLMAKSIASALWPEAAGQISTNVRKPINPDARKSQPCLLSGPEGKQIVRSEDGVWYAISGRSRGGKPTDLVFSWTRDPRPAWNDFKHITLIGPERGDVFDDQDRTLTGAMLLEHQHRIYVVFSWNVGVFMISTDGLGDRKDDGKGPRHRT